MDKIDIIRKIFEDENDVRFKKGNTDDDILIIIEGCPEKKIFHCYNYNFEDIVDKMAEYIYDCRELIRKDDDEILSYNKAIKYIEWQSAIHSIKIYATYNKNIIFNKPDIKGYFVININDIILTKKLIDCFFVGMVKNFDNGNYIKDFDAIYMDMPQNPLSDDSLSTEYPVAGINKKFYYYWTKGDGQKRYITKSDFEYLRYLKFMANRDDAADVLRYSIIHGMSGNFSVTKIKTTCLSDECTEYRVTSNIGHSVGSFIMFLEQFKNIFGEIHIECISNNEVYFYVKN